MILKRKLQQLQNVLIRLWSLFLDIIVTQVIAGDAVKLRTALFLEFIAYPFSVLSGPIPSFATANKWILSFKPLGDFVVRNHVGTFGVSTRNDTLTASSANYDRVLERWILAPRRNAFIDIGGNVGQYALRAAKSGYKHIYTFEANPSTADVLARNIRFNSAVAKKISLQRIALADKPGILSFGVMHGYTGGCKVLSATELSYLKKNAAARAEVTVIPVKAVTFDSHLASMKISAADISFIKMDVEDFEYFVLRGMQKTLATLKNETKLMIELRDQNPHREKVLQLLQSLSFAIVAVHDDNYLFERSIASNLSHRGSA